MAAKAPIPNMDQMKTIYILIPLKMNSVVLNDLAL
jgi:hypothetical protein